jgi:hypothetical protein
MKLYKESPSFRLEKIVCGLLFICASLTFALPTFLGLNPDYMSYIMPGILFLIGCYFLYLTFIRNTVLIVEEKGLTLSYLGSRYSQVVPWTDIDSLEIIFFKTPSYFNGKAILSYIMLKSTKKLNLPKPSFPRLQFGHLWRGNNREEYQKIAPDVQALIPLHRFQSTDRSIRWSFFDSESGYRAGITAYWDRMRFYGELTLQEILSFKK